MRSLRLIKPSQTGGNEANIELWGAPSIAETPIVSHDSSQTRRDPRAILF
jgi:hypothetical protein